MVEAIGGTETTGAYHEQHVTDSPEVEATNPNTKDAHKVVKHPLRSLEISHALKSGILERTIGFDPKNLRRHSPLQKLLKGVNVLQNANKGDIPSDLKAVYANIKQWQSKYSIHSEEYRLAQTILAVMTTTPQPTSLTVLNERLFGPPNGVWYVDPKSTKAPFNNVFYLFPTVDIVGTVEFFVQVLKVEPFVLTPLACAAVSITKVLDDNKLKTSGGEAIAKEILKNIYSLNPLAGGGPGHTIDVDQTYWINGLGQGAFDTLDLWSKNPDQSVDDFCADCALLATEFSSTINPVQLPSKDVVALCWAIRSFQNSHGGESSPAGQLAQQVFNLPELWHQPVRSQQALQQLFTKYLQQGADIPSNCAPRDLYATFPGVTGKDLADLFQALNLTGKEEKPTIPDVALAALVQIKDFKGEDEKARQYSIDHISKNMIHASHKDRLDPIWQEHMMRSGGDSAGLWQQITAKFDISPSALRVLSNVLYAQGPWPQKPS